VTPPVRADSCTEDFVHRCGRTGRAGKTGKAVTFFTGEGHEKSLAGEFMRVIRDAGGEVRQFNLVSCTSDSVDRYQKRWTDSPLLSRRKVSPYLPISKHALT